MQIIAIVEAAIDTTRIHGILSKRILIPSPHLEVANEDHPSRFG